MYAIIKSLPADIKKVVCELSLVRGVKAVYLYGSRAWREFRPSSDYDLCVFTKKDVSERIKTRILSMSSEKADVTLFWDLPPVMRIRVLIDGKPYAGLMNHLSTVRRPRLQGTTRT